MNACSPQKRNLLVSISTICMFLLGFAGCENSDQATVDRPETIQSKSIELTGDEILASVRQQYSQATSYQDNAVLYLNYRLNGRAIQEPHPWSVAWNRNQQFSADWFNAQIRCDGKFFSCYVYDIETGNIDNQQLWIPVKDRLPLANLQQDPIAQHFIFGTSELLLDESEAKRINPLTQPLVGFLDSSFMPRWLQSPDTVGRLDDAKLNDTSCHRIKISSSGKNYILWINQRSGIIEQIDLPLQYLHSEVLAAKEITNLKLFARFHESQLNSMVPPKRLVTEKKLAAKTVSRFVELPESLPSAMIGEHVGKLKFQDRSGADLELEKGAKPTVLLWLSAAEPQLRLKELQTLKNSLPSDSANLFAVYSDEFLADPASDSRLFAKPFESLSQSLFPLLYDRELGSSVALKIKAIPCLLVLDSEMRVQYADGIDQSDWVQNASVAVKRISSGENVANEMRAEYQKYLDEYHQQIVLANNKTEASVLNQTNRPQVDISWTNDSLKEPGNIHVPTGSKFAYVFDGWQTVVQMNIATGATVKRFSLNLPEGSAVNRLRSVQIKSKQLRFMAFSMLGKQVFVFDENFNRITEFPRQPAELAHAGITNCQWIENGTSLLCSFIDKKGVVNYDVETGNSSTRLALPTKTFCKLGSALLHVNEGRFVLDSQFLRELEQIKATAAYPFPNDDSRCLVVGVDPRSRWQMFCIDANGSVSWSRAIENQYFNHGIESVSIGGTGAALSIAVASSEGVLQIFDDRGNLVETRAFDNAVTGLCVARSIDGNKLLVCQESVKCLPLERKMASVHGGEDAGSRR